MLLRPRGKWNTLKRPTKCFVFEESEEKTSKEAASSSNALSASQLNLHHGTLVRGDGVFEQKGFAHDQGFVSSPSPEAGAIGKQRKSVMLTLGAFPPFIETRVFINNVVVTFHKVNMEQSLQLMIASDLDTVRQSFLKVDWKHSLGSFRSCLQMFQSLGGFLLVIGVTPFATV